MRKLIIYFILITNIFALESGIGNIDIEVNIVPELKTKKYNIGERIVLDVGTYNSKFGLDLERKIATVNVSMNTKKVNLKSGDDLFKYCILDGEFNLPYKLNKLKNNLLEGDIPLKELKNYYKGEEVTLVLKERNFRITNITIYNEDSQDEDYTFSAYPEECKKLEQVKNIVSSLNYSFDLYIDVMGTKSGTIVGDEVIIEETEIESAIGSAADLVKRQFLRMQE